MSKRLPILFSLLFCCIVGSVGVVQMVMELRRGDRLQLGDLPVDMVVTPLQRARKVRSEVRTLVDSLNAYRSSGALLGTGAYERADELAAAALSLRATVINVNRYTVDSTSRSARYADSLSGQLQVLLDAADRTDTTAVQSITAATVGLAKQVADACPGASGTIPGYLHALLDGIFGKTLFNREYLRAYEKQIEERSVFMLAIRPVMQVVRYLLLKDVGEKVIYGRDGWLFYRPGIEYLYRPSVYDPRSRSVDYNDRAIDDDPVAVIADFRDQLAERNIELLVVIVPGKGSIYPDFLSTNITVDQCRSISPTPGIIARLRQAAIEVVYLQRPLLDERSDDSAAGDRVYLARDTHWRGRGVLRAAESVAAAVKNRPWYHEAHTEMVWTYDTVEVARTGDVGVMTGLPDVSLKNLHLSFAPEVTKAFPVWHNYLDSSGAVIERVPYKNDFRKSRILVLGDSFSRIYQTDEPRGAGWIAHLARELSEPLGAVISDGGASTLVREKLARKPGMLKGKRLVIWEFVERDLRYGAYGWKMVDIP